MESAPRNVQVRPLSSSMMMITWEPPETPNGQVTVSIIIIVSYFIDRWKEKGRNENFKVSPSAPTNKLW